MKKFLFLIFFTICLSSCTTKTPKVMSPCVANSFSDHPGPCIKRPVNIWLA
jgi:hypothetical protein